MQTDAVLSGLADLPSGPELASTLAGLYLTEVPNDGIVEVMQAQARQLAHEQARLLAVMVEVSRTTPGTARCRAIRRYEWAAGEIAAALTLTASSADRELGFADVLVRGLPAVFAAMQAGRLDRAKAWVFAQHLDPASCGLAPELIEALCAQFVPPASGWTAGQLAARLLRAIIAIDPEHARRRYTRAIRERAVCAYLDESGTVTITATGLPAPEAAAACERLERLAAAAKRAGHPGRVHQIQADVFLGLLDGRYHHHTETQIIADLLARATTVDEPETSWRQVQAATASAPATTVGGTPDPVKAPDPVGACCQASTPGVQTNATAASTSPDSIQESAEQPRMGVEVRVGLRTLLGLDECPGEIPGLGPLIAPAARELVTSQHQGSTWRFAVTDSDGYLVLAGTTRRRPQVLRPPATRPLGGVVEIHLSESTLAELVAAPSRNGSWARVIADIAAQYCRRDDLVAGLEQRPHTRFARGALARHVEIRDRTCTHPGCRRPARKSDLDHTLDYSRGGRTARSNVGPGCPRHHRYKTELGWQLRQPRPGHFEWTSPLGRTYRTRGEPIAPSLPGSAPTAAEFEPMPPEAVLPEEQHTILHLPAPVTRTRPSPLVSDHDPPPF